MARYSFNDLGVTIEKNFPQLHRLVAGFRGRGPAVAQTLQNVTPAIQPPAIVRSDMGNVPRQRFSPTHAGAGAPHPVPSSRAALLNRGPADIQRAIRRSP